MTYNNPDEESIRAEPSLALADGDDSETSILHTAPRFSCNQWAAQEP